jgi:hypothetical protein
MGLMRRCPTWVRILFLAVALQGVTPDASNLVFAAGFRLLFQFMGAPDDWDLAQDSIEVVSGLPPGNASRMTRRHDEAPLEIIPSIRLIVKLSGVSASRDCCCGSIVQSHDPLSALSRFRC